MAKKIVVVSHTSFRRVGRAVYVEFFKKGLDITIIHPITLYAADGTLMHHEPKSEDDPPLIALHQTTRNPRIHTYKGILKHLNKIKPNIIILENDPISFLALQIGLWAKFKHVKLLCITNDNVSRTLKNSYKRQGFKGLLYSMLLQCVNFFTRPLIHHLFVISNAGLKVFVELGYAHKISKIPLGFDTKIFYKDDVKRTEKREELGLTKEPVIAYFGRMKFQKGIHVLIEALALIKEKPWKFMLDYFEEGGDEYKKLLFDLIKKYNLGERILWVHANHLEVANYMRAADIIVVPSLETSYFVEQYGRVVPESMACGALTIVSNTGALPELLNNYGWKFEQGNAMELSKILCSVLELNSDQKNKMSERASSYALLNLSINKQSELMEKFLAN
ncbi:MAG: glycosyltransferase family 4 protein [Bacteroidia bacterium]